MSRAVPSGSTLTRTASTPSRKPSGGSAHPQDTRRRRMTLSEAIARETAWRDALREFVEHPRHNELDGVRLMQEHGQSFTLNWGEDNALWECSWISGKRYTGFSRTWVGALKDCAKHAIVDDPDDEVPAPRQPGAATTGDE